MVFGVIRGDFVSRRAMTELIHEGVREFREFHQRIGVTRRVGARQGKDSLVWIEFFCLALTLMLRGRSGVGVLTIPDDGLVDGVFQRGGMITKGFDVFAVIDDEGFFELIHHLERFAGGGDK